MRRSLHPSFGQASGVRSALHPSGVPAAAAGGTPRGLGPDALGAGMSASTVALPAAATLVWVGALTGRDAMGWMAQCTFDASSTVNHRGLVLRDAAGAPSALAFGSGGATAIANGTLAGLDAGDLCVLVAVVTASGGTLRLTSGLAGGAPASVTAAVTGSIAHATATPGAWQAIGLGTNARCAGRGELYILGAALSQSEAEALVTSDGTPEGALAACRALAAHAAILASAYPDTGTVEGETLVAGTVDGATWTLHDSAIYAGGLNVAV